MLMLSLHGCAFPGPYAARAAWIQEQLTADNAYWLARSPDLVATKYTRMRAAPYDWMRGTTTLFLQDQLRPDPDRASTRFLVEPDAASVLLVGDPHIENLGTLLPGEEPDPGDADADAAVTLEWVDLDAAAFGPWTIDTRRAALGIALLAAHADLDPDAPVARFAEGYADELLRRAAGEPGWDATEEAETDGALVRALREDVREDGVTADALDDDTSVTSNGVRRLLRDDVLVDGDGVLDLRPAEAGQLDRVLDGWIGGRPTGFRVLDAVRRYGKGVSSLPATRFLVLWDRGGEGLEDDRLLNVREVVDPPSVDGLVAGIGAVYVDNADRIAAVPARLWSRPDADVRVGGVADGAAAFKTTTLSGWSDTFDHEDIVDALMEGEASPADLDALAALAGRALASAHARGTTLDGAPALDVIAADLERGGGADALIEERVRDATVDLEAMGADHALFRALLDQVGPLLGAEALYR